MLYWTFLLTNLTHATIVKKILKFVSNLLRHKLFVKLLN